jgi:stearoyl-CoA desaturase (delta-9 desaturase)
LQIRNFKFIIIEHHMKLKNINWPIFTFLVAYQLLVIVLAPFYFYYTPPSLAMILVSVVLFILTGISITTAYHRLYSHRSYKVSKLVEVPLLFFGTLAGQGSVLRWAYDHRLHHNYVDTDKDPYSVKKGFWYAHILWMFEKREDINPKAVNDLLENRLVVLQDKYYVPLFFGLNALVSILIGWLLGDFAGAFYLAWWLRLFAVHHSTWFINSLAHTWGSKSYSREFSAVDNYIISLLTFGEGYHNYHHFFATDFRNGIKWYHFDPTKWLIWSLSKMGLASNLREIDPLKIKKQVIKNDRALLFDRLPKLPVAKKNMLEAKAKEAYDIIMERISEINTLNKKYLIEKKNSISGNLKQDLRDQINDRQNKLKQDWDQWHRIFKTIMRTKTVAG